MKRFISWILCFSMLLATLPATAMAAVVAEAAAAGSCTIDNGYIRIEVSEKNGGFAVNTVEGNRLKKSDDNKRLLFHNGAYDTSFISYHVEDQNGKAQDYLFGGKYGDDNDPSRKGVTVTQPTKPNGEITATWSVGTLTFTQVITLANEAADEHGMVSIALSAKNSGSAPVKIKARVLMDTYLGDRDFGYYQVSAGEARTRVVKTEEVITVGSDSNPQNFFAVDDPYDPGVIAYSVSKDSKPYQAAFGHWNNLAASLFNFTPDKTMDFTSKMNPYLTDDSAYALYYDLGDVAAAGTAALTTYYGVYANSKVSSKESVAVNMTAPIRLELNAKGDGYEPLLTHGIADFMVNVNFENYKSETAKDLSGAILAVTRTGNLRSLGDEGEELAEQTFEDLDPLTVTYESFKVGEIKDKKLYFEARPCEVATYERITVTIYDGAVDANKKLGEKTVYVLLPGLDGKVPKVNFASMTPEIIYDEGTRHLFATVTNASMLENRAVWALQAYSTDKKTSLPIPHDQITIKDGVMDVVLTDKMKMATGSWFLQLEWTDAAISTNLVPKELQHQTAPALRFNVSHDKQYKNNAYGVLCAVEYTVEGRPTYQLKSFKDEADFTAFSKHTGKYTDEAKFAEILLVFRGEFIATKSVTPSTGEVFTYYTAVSTKKLDGSRNYVVDNGISINGCMDFEGGNMAVYYEDYNSLTKYASSPICVEFDGELLTSDARTSVWTGKAALTKIEQGSAISLLPYDKNGVRKGNFTDETIKLIWPSVFGAGQQLAGMLFNMAFGELGVMKDNDEELGRVLSFSASLDLSFVTPQAGAAPKTTFWTKFKDLWKDYTTDTSIYQYTGHTGSINRMLDLSNVDEGHSGEKQLSGSVMVQDILFGCGMGFVGVHFNVEFAMANFVEALPKISGKLEVNTINDWAFAFSGGMEIASFEAQAKLSFKSHNDIPVPDEIYFFIGGFKPGINIDACGVLWITGGGGGISDLYDTIFLTQAVPPLKLILSVAFSVVQVLDGQASLTLGLTGIKLEANDLKIFGTITAIDHVLLGLEWYPGIDLRAAISVNLLDTIKGAGYIVLIGKDYTQWSFEMFARAELSVPKSVPVVGGIKLFGVDLGLSDKKIWGAIEVLMITLGITYYWGEPGVDFTSGSKAQPTYPDLLGYDDVPVAYDAEQNRTLYAHFGTNISEISHAETIDLSGDIRLMGKGVQSDIGLTLHKFNLGEYKPANKAAIVQLTYDAESMADARTKAAAVQVKPNRDMSGDAYPLILCDETSSNLDVANANVSYDEVTKKATFAFTVTKETDYNQDWFISTGETKADVVLYNVDTPPEVTSVSGAVAGQTATLTWDGSDLGELDKLSFYLSPTNDPTKTDDAVLLTALTNKAVIETTKSATIPLPASLPSGDYYVRAVYSKTDEVNGTCYSAGTITHANTYLPADCGSVTIAPAGNLTYQVTVPKIDDTNTTGYRVTVYNADGTPTEITDLTHEKAAGTATVFDIGGSYQAPAGKGKAAETHGLVAGKSYLVGVTPYRSVDTDNNQKPDSVVYGAEVRTAATLLPACTRPTATFTANATPKSIPYDTLQDTDGDPATPAVPVKLKRDTYTGKDITFTAALTEAATGTWKLDDAAAGTVTGDAVPIAYNPMGTFTSSKSVQIPLKKIPDGSHKLTVEGKDAQGDTFQAELSFDVDTLAPNLMLTSPVSGSMFGKTDGSVTISGVTDADARFTITSDGALIGTELQTVAQLGGTIDSAGVFSFTVKIPDHNSASNRTLGIIAADAAGNSVTKQVQVTHGGLADLESISILVDGAALSYGNIPVGAVGETAKTLTLAGVTSDNSVFQLTPSHVSWVCQAVAGDVSVTPDGQLTAAPQSQGMITGRIEVGTNAFRTASMSVGASNGGGVVAVSASIGGSVTGGGTYNPNETVTLTAVPDGGYVFSGWTVEGVTPSTGLTANPLVFTMPTTGNVTVSATFSPIGGGSTGRKPAVVKEGTVGTLPLPSNADPTNTVPCYVDKNGKTVIVTLSAVIDGKLVFVAPADAHYSATSNPVKLSDISGNWAEREIQFTAARGLFEGVGEDLFNPAGPMTRSMFVTILHRMAGSPEPKHPSSFTDVSKDAWYAQAVAWASENAIVSGYSSQLFGSGDLVTREQMCVLFARYLRQAGYSLPTKGAPAAFSDVPKISDWAKEDTLFCQSIGLMQGKPGNLAAPQANAVRAEGAVMFTRLIESIVGAQK